MVKTICFRCNGVHERGQCPRGSRPHYRQRVAARDALIRRDGLRCAYCGCQPGPKNPIHVDHIKPFSMGGSNSLSNLQLLCQDCNLAKGAS